jgi:hypothetical protein
MMKYSLAKIENGAGPGCSPRVRHFGIEFDSPTALIAVLAKARALGIDGPLAIVETPAKLQQV